MRKLLYIPLIVMLNLFQHLNAQQNKIDSLLTLLKTDKEDTNKLKHLSNICDTYNLAGEYDSVLIYGKQSLELAKSIGLKEGIANCYKNMGVVYANHSNYSEALKNHSAALKIREEMLDKKGMASSYNSLGVVYMNQGNLPEALKMYFTALKIYEEITNREGIASSYGNIGNVYGQQGNYTEALKSFSAALKIYEEVKNKKGIAYIYTNIGTIYFSQNNYPKALKNYSASLHINQEIGDRSGISDSYIGIGIVYMNQGNYPAATDMYLASLKIKEEIADKEGISTCYINLGELYVKTNKPKEAQNYLDKALQLCQEIGSKDGMKYCYSYKIILDSITGNYKAAFEHHKLYIIYGDSLNNEETQKKSLQASMQYEFDKKEIAVKAAQELRDKLQEEETKKQKLFLGLVSFILILVGVFAVFMCNRFRITQRQKIIIETQKKQADKAYEQLHEKNKEVMDSIRYAKRIQTALITSEKYITNSLNRLMKD